MKCPQCGAWSLVLDKRGDRRRRECGNGHRFASIEIYETERSKKSEAALLGHQRRKQRKERQ